MKPLRAQSDGTPEGDKAAKLANALMDKWPQALWDDIAAEATRPVVESVLYGFSVYRDPEEVARELARKHLDITPQRGSSAKAPATSP